MNRKASFFERILEKNKFFIFVSEREFFVSELKIVVSDSELVK